MELFSRDSCRALQALQDGWQYLKIQLLKASHIGIYIHTKSVKKSFACGCIVTMKKKTTGPTFYKP